MDEWVLNVLSAEFIDALVNSILGMGIRGNLVEIGAGTGKLSYWLRQYGIPIHATDKTPAYKRKDSNSDSSKEVEELDCLEALDRYDPEFVLTSWLDSDAGQKNIIEEVLELILKLV